MNRASVSCGFDLSVLNEFSTGNYFPVHTELHEHTFLSDRHHLRTYRYLNCPPARPALIKVSESGVAHGVVSWFTADFGDAHISNEPFSGSHWHQAYHPLPQEMTLEEGDSVHLLIDDDGFATVTR
jgi:type II protein arginine methyltransferase